MARASTFSMRFAACILPFVATSAQSTRTCAFRLINEYSANINLFINNNVTAVDTQAVHGVSVYHNADCSSAVALTLSPAAANTGVNTLFVAPEGQNAFTVLAAVTSNLGLSLSVIPDMNTAIPNGVNNIDMCAVRIINALDTAVTCGGVTSECFDCLHPLWQGNTIALPGQASQYQTVFCGVPYSVQASLPSVGISVTAVVPMAEHGVYSLVIQRPDGDAPLSPTSMLTTAVVTDAEGQFPYSPIIAAIFILLAMGVLHRAVGWLLVHKASHLAAGKPADGVTLLSFFGYDKLLRKSQQQRQAAAAQDNDAQAALLPTYTAPVINGTTADVETVKPVATDMEAKVKAPTTTKPGSAGRIRGIDTLRGAALVLMIFVNYGAGGYMVLDHAKWNGLNLADLLFPTFVWTQGVSMAISFDSLRKKQASRWDMAIKVLIRAVKLYALGCFLNGGATLSEWRLLGVLQYFAVSYLFVGLLEIFVRPVGEGKEQQAQPATGLRALGSLFWNDIGRYWVQWVIMGIIGGMYLLVQRFLEVDGCPVGYIGPGGLAQQGMYAGCTGGAHRTVDLAFFGVHHMYHNGAGDAVYSAATCADAGMAYDCDIYDPEGVLGWISACWTTFLGLQAGRVFVGLRQAVNNATSPAARVAMQWRHVYRWAVWGIVFGLIGGAMCGFAKETGTFPINKNLWSPSFVFVMGGLDFIILSAIYLMVDVYKLGSGSPLCYVGMNSIVIYAGHEILQGFFPFESHSSTTWVSHAEAMASNVAGVLCWVMISRYLYQRKIFINI